MATKPLSQEPTISAVTADDKFVLVNNPSGTADTALITAANAALFFQSGMVTSSQLGASSSGSITGVATLGTDGKVLSTQLPAITSGVTSVNGSTGALTGILTSGDIGVNVAGLVAGKVPTSQLPGSIQSATRAVNASTSTVIDFAFQQNVVMMDQAASFTFGNATPGAKTTLILVMDATGGRLATFPGSNFAFDQITSVAIGYYPNEVTTLGFEVREDGVTVRGFGLDVDRSASWDPFSALDTFPRTQLFAGGGGNPITSGTLRLTYFRAKVSKAVSNCDIWVKTAPTSTTNTHGYVAMFEVDISNWGLKCIAVSADDTTMFSTASTAGTLVTKAWTTFQMYSGRWYAFGVGYSGTGVTASPSIVSARAIDGNNVALIPPRITGTLTQTALPTIGQTFTDASAAAYDTMYYANFR